MERTGIIKLPDRFRDPFQFEEIISLQKGILENGIALDLSRITFIEPYSMLSLLLMGRTFLRLRGEKLQLVGIPLAVHQYLNRMDFFKMGIFQDAGLQESMNLKRSAASRRLIEVTEIPGKERQSIKAITRVISVFRKRAGLILKQWISEEVTDYFVTVISEVCQNIFEHSFDSGFVAMQTYTAGGEDIVRLVISDSGIGIPESLKDRIKEDTHAGRIEKALMTTVSSKRNFGYGLCQVNTIVSRLKGSIHIRSMDASVTVLYQKKAEGSPHIFLKNGLSVFDGTQISISLSSRS